MLSETAVSGKTGRQGRLPNHHLPQTDPYPGKIDQGAVRHRRWDLSRWFVHMVRPALWSPNLRPPRLAPYSGEIGIREMIQDREKIIGQGAAVHCLERQPQMVEFGHANHDPAHTGMTQGITDTNLGPGAMFGA